MSTKDLRTLAIVGLGAYALYKWRSRSQLTPDAKEQFFGLTEANSPAQQSKLDADKLVIPVDNGVYRVDPTNLNPYQQWYVSKGLYTVVNDVLKPTWWLRSPVDVVKDWFA